MSMQPYIASGFDHIDQLQRETFAAILELVELSEQNVESTFFESKKAEVLASATENIQLIRDTLRVLDVQIDDINSHKAVAKLKVYREKLNNLRTKLRECQARLSSKDNEVVHKQRLEKYLKVTKQNERDELFAGRTLDKQQQTKKTVQEQILSQNKSISNTLKQTRHLMNTSIMQTELNIDLVDQQSADLATLNDKLLDLNSVLQASGQIVKFIRKQDKQDKQRIYLSIGFLLLCSAWVIWRRILKTPVRIMLWTFFKLFGVVNFFIRAGEADAALEETAISISASTTLEMPLSSLSEAVSTLSEAVSEVLSESVLAVSEFSSVTDLDLTFSEVIETTVSVLLDEL